MEVSTLRLMYTFNSGLASSFCFTSIIILRPLQLRMFYQYTSSVAGSNTAAHAMQLKDGPKPQIVQANPKDGSAQSDWFFECDLEASGAGATIGTVVAAISDDTVGALPSFVSGITIPTAGGRNPVSIKVAKTNNNLMFVLRIVIEEFTLMFIQIAQKDNANPPKRLLRFAVDKIPLIEKVPLLDKLPQPFDQLEYFWVNGPQGFLLSEVDALNNLNNSPQLLVGEDRLIYKDATGEVRDVKGAPQGTPDAVVIQPGHHFIVVHNKVVAIDHIFNATPKPPPAPAQSSTTGPTYTTTQTLAAARTQSLPRTSTDPAPSIAPSPPTKGTVVLKLGPLSITAVTLQNKEQSAGSQKILSIELDATFAMGPMSFSLLGFSLGVPLSGKITLKDLSGLAEHVIVSIHGLSFEFRSPPLLIAGGFEHEIVADGEIYMGGLGICFPPYTFVGLGEYKILHNYKSVFIYAKLDSPLIELELATISGVRLGFGYNSLVRSPSINQLTSFPFINDTGTSGAGNDPMAKLKSLVEIPKDQPWVTAKQDSYWFAAGMSITAFDILQVTAVAMFAFHDSGPIISLFADAVAQMLPAANDRREMIVYVEIGLVAEVNFGDGYFRVEASLAPTSFLLVPQCHLEGGFALVYWFSPNEHAGDWVFSIGGYHKNYLPPAWYPVPKRIGIAFSIDILQIVEEAYFAVTPKVAMGRALIHVSLAFGPIKAWLDAAMDALVNFHPLHYIADFKVCVGVTFCLDVWFIHKHISASVGAWLHLEGPEFGGHARVDFYLFGFTVDFGATNRAPDPLDLVEFWEMVHKPGPSSTPLDNDADKNPLQGCLAFNEYDSEKKALSKTKDGKDLPMLIPEEGAALKSSSRMATIRCHPRPAQPLPPQLHLQALVLVRNRSSAVVASASASHPTLPSLMQRSLAQVSPSPSTPQKPPNQFTPVPCVLNKP
ncbi:hypothetical protein BDZ45DRAFT_269894 [Acephala macrosclerotiorum]|nr:hypothetical protein BDZ45DRAFT_269894 [Acephala macrosclerotiorum]